jgi:hypothetical protein
MCIPKWHLFLERYRGHLHGRSGDGKRIGYHEDVWLRAGSFSHHSYILVSFSVASVR